MAKVYYVGPIDGLKPEDWDQVGKRSKVIAHLSKIVFGGFAIFVCWNFIIASLFPEAIKVTFLQAIGISLAILVVRGALSFVFLLYQE